MSENAGFIAKHILWSEAQIAAARRVFKTIESKNLRTIRVSVADPQGKLRSKTVTPKMFRSVMKNGLDFTSAQFNFDSAEGIAHDAFTEDGGVGLPEMAGFPDVVLVPDPLTFRVLPWAESCGWIQGDMYFNDGRPLPFDARHILRKVDTSMREAGYRYVAGLAVEFYVTRVVQEHWDPSDMGNLGLPPTPPTVAAIGYGYAYQSEAHQDRIDSLLNVLARHCAALELPLRTMEDEMGPGQLEFTFEPQSALDAADAMTLFRSMVKQVCARMGLHATFMAQPGLDNFCASGWHLRQSMMDCDGKNVFAAAADSTTLLSPIGEHFVAGLLAHAVEASVFCTPTINGYKRRKSHSLVPNRVTWGYGNRAAMCRVQGGPGDLSSHVENRIGEPAANPYLYLACQIAAGMDGVARQLSPGPLEAIPYTAIDCPLLPQTLMEALDRLREGTFYRTIFGTQFIDWFLRLKQNEVNRFLAAEPDWNSAPDRVTDWEHREYFMRY